MKSLKPLIDRCLAVESTRCTGIPAGGEVLCPRHVQLKDAGENFLIAIVPLEEFNQDELPT